MLAFIIKKTLHRLLRGLIFHLMLFKSRCSSTAQRALHMKLREVPANSDVGRSQHLSERNLDYIPFSISLRFLRLLTDGEPETICRVGGTV